MVEDNDNRGGNYGCSQNKENPGDKIGLFQKGVNFFRESKVGFDGFLISSPKPQELTVSYISETSNQDDGEKWVVRDFMNLSEKKNMSSSKRVFYEEVEEKDVDFERENGSRSKKPKLESCLNLSLALPDVSHSLTASNALQNGDFVAVRPRSCRSVQPLGLEPSNDVAQTTCSNNLTAASVTYSHSYPFSHNPSCSLTHNSTEIYECSVGRDDQIWCGGEGTNGSVHSRFRPIGDGLVAFSNNNSNHGGRDFSVLRSHCVINKDSCNDSSLNMASSESLSFFPAELPARPRLDAYSGDSRRKVSENLRDLECVEAGGRGKKLSTPEKIIHEIVTESVLVMAQIVREMAEETLESTKEYVKNLIILSEKREELVILQDRLRKRSDLSKETLLKCQKVQLEILVALKLGLVSFISGKVRLSTHELVEIFLYMRCRNVNCKSILPVDDCDCKFCSGNEGFCSSCMCPVCMNFDCANNTCSWVGCDVCSHWCHAACGIQNNLIRPGQSLKGPKGTAEMQFYCIGCNHASEMFGFVKDVFVCCAKHWGFRTLMKEIDCVKNIFKQSEDIRGKRLHTMAAELLSGLESKAMSPSDACKVIIQFFNYADSTTDSLASGVTAKELIPTETILTKDKAAILPATSHPPKNAISDPSSSGVTCNPLSMDLCRNDCKAMLLGDLKLEDRFQFGKMSKNHRLDGLDSILRIKEAEARMFQSKAEEARREAKEYLQMIRAKSEKLEGEYVEKLAKLRLQEAEERRQKKLEELKVLEHAKDDYHKMKFRMQAEISVLLKRMENGNHKTTVGLT